jgi:hypothetical protein
MAFSAKAILNPQPIAFIYVFDVHDVDCGASAGQLINVYQD